jgi:hypothetical protein
MGQTEAPQTWVVYRMTLYRGVVGGNAVCEQREWDALERARPGFHLLIRSGIKTEQEAEKLARGTAGDAKPRQSGRKLGAGDGPMPADSRPPAVLWCGVCGRRAPCPPDDRDLYARHGWPVCCGQAMCYLAPADPAPDAPLPPTGGRRDQ